MVYRLIGVSMKDIKSSSGKKIGEMSIIDNSYVIDNFYKPEIVSICKDVINNASDEAVLIKILYDEYYLSIGEIATILGYSYGKTNRHMFPLEQYSTNKNDGRRNRAYGTTVSPTQSEKMSAALMGRTCWNKGVPCRKETKEKLSIYNSKHGKYGTVYFGEFTSAKYNNIFKFRSLLELYYMIYLEEHDVYKNVVWESIIIPYELDGFIHRYIPDLLADDDLIEVKSFEFMKIYSFRKLQFTEKIKAANIYAKENGLKYKIITDRKLGYITKDFKKFLNENPSIITQYNIKFITKSPIKS